MISLEISSSSPQKRSETQFPKFNFRIYLATLFTSIELEQVVLPLKISLPFALLKNKTILDLVKNYCNRIFTPDYLIFIFKTQPNDSRTNT